MSRLAGWMGCFGMVGLTACVTPDIDRTPATYDTHPETPAIVRDVALVGDDAEFTQPYVPGHRTTMDGRVALRVQGGPPGTEVMRTMLSFSLFRPEALTAPILSGPAGAEILASPTPFNVVFPPALAPGVSRLGHHAICDPTEPFPKPGERPNPYVCGPELAHDCYDLVVLSTTSNGTSSQVWGTPATVEVEAPKTQTAQIVDVRLGEPVAGTIIPFNNEFTEPAITRDGRLLTGRLGRFPRAWTHPGTGETFFRPYDLAYAVLPAGAEPCDVRGWTSFHPMSHAPYDPAMVGTYGLAAYPFRDSEGAPIPDGEDLGGTYPWVDREGANVFMTGVHGRMVEQSPTEYPRRCVHEGCEAYSENTDWDRGFLVGGLWTHGKFVHLDSMINSVDWAVGVTPKAHYLVDLYKSDAGEPVSVRLGAGRFIDSVRDAGGPYPAAYTHNANVLDSLQNLPNHHTMGKPITPRDVVWIMSTGVATDEVAFDDYLDPRALIVSDMVASITQLYDDEGRSLAIPHHHNGQVRRLESTLPVLASLELFPDEQEEIHLQNAATSLTLNPPAYGRVDTGTGRVEPAALGGVHGKGFWLTGSNAVVYDMPSQPVGAALDDLYLGLFLDPRVRDAAWRQVLRFPDTTWVQLGGSTELRIGKGDTPALTLDLPVSSGWVHLGLAVHTTAAGSEVEVLINGMAVERFTSAEPLFGVPAGTLRLGADDGGLGVRGWIDSFRVLAHAVDPEVACNQAGGTLIDVQDHAAWNEVASRSPSWAHEAIAQAAGRPATARFACYQDTSDDHVAHLASIPQGTSSVRTAIHFPEGPLRSGAPRPDSSGNNFCLSCHTAEGKGGLSLDALALRPGVPAEDDPRRQPSQPPRRVFGHVPAGWIPPGPGVGGPAEAMVAPSTGALIDRWVLPE